MILNLIHRPATGRLRSMFDLQQQMAHSLGLKVTVLIPYDTMFEPDIVQGLLEDHSRYGDELGIWFGEIATDRMNEVLNAASLFFGCIRKKTSGVLLILYYTNSLPYSAVRRGQWEAIISTRNPCVCFMKPVQKSRLALPGALKRASRFSRMQ